MRIWSVHPEYLDTRGLVALWREALLAKKVLEGRTKGYKNHPQLDRFKAADNPSELIDHYLSVVYNEAVKRGYKFDRDKINWNFTPGRLTVTKGQLIHETFHLLGKLKSRDRERFNKLTGKEFLRAHPIFRTVRGDVEKWEGHR